MTDTPSTREVEVILNLLEAYNVGIGEIPTSGDVFHVDSGHGDASDVSGNGKTWDAPFASLHYAVSQCTGSAGDVIYLAARHAETITATAGALCILDTDGVTIVGRGSGNNRPTFTLGATAALINVDGANVKIVNCIFKPGNFNTTILMDIDGIGVRVEKCLFEMTISSYRAVTGVDIATDDCVVHDCTFLSKTNGAQRAIMISATADNVQITKNWIEGDWDDAGIASASTFTNALIANNFVSNMDSGEHAIELKTGDPTGLLLNNKLYSDSMTTMLEPGNMKCIDNMAVSATNEGGVPIPAQPSSGAEAVAGGGGALQNSGDTWFVDSGASSGQETGKSWQDAFITLDDAFESGMVTANNGDVVLLAAGHAEDITTATPCVMDKAGVWIIGTGHGADMAKFTIKTNTTATLTISAASVRITNIMVTSDLDDVAIGITIANGGDDAIIEDCLFKDGANNKEVLIDISLAADADRITIRNNRFLTASGGGCANSINLIGATDETIIEGNYFWGDWSAEVIDGLASAGTMILCKKNIIHNLDTGAGLTISFNAATTGTMVGNRCYGAKVGINIAGTAMAMIDNVVTNAVSDSGRLVPPMLPSDVQGKHFYVDSGAGGSADGLTWPSAVTTVEAAVALCNANAGDVINVAEGHAETISDAVTVDLDKAGLTLIGYGTGLARPTFTFDSDAGEFRIDAASVHVENVLLLNDNDNTAAMINITGSGTDFEIINCEIREGDNAKFADAMLVTANGADRGLIKGCQFRANSGAGMVSVLQIDGSDDLEIVDCWMYGNASVSVIDFLTTASLRMNVHDCVLWTEHANDICIKDTITGCSGVLGPNISMVLQENAANITEAITAPTCYVIDFGVTVVNAVNEKSLAINWGASGD